MAFELTVLPRAGKEILDAIDWYEKRRNGLGEIFLAEVETKFQRIFENPLLYPVFHTHLDPTKKPSV